VTKQGREEIWGLIEQMIQSTDTIEKIV